MNPLVRLAQLGQSVYLDELSRPMIERGELGRLIDQDDIHGVTTNPAIFEKAIGQTDDYDDAIAELVETGVRGVDLYERLAVDDVRAAADLFAPLYGRSDGLHGHVSLEVSPLLAHDTEGTIAEARRLSAAVDRDNVFIKVPGTQAGLDAIRTLTADGIHVNVTLLFGLGRYEAVTDAYLSGLEDRVARGDSPQGIASVASFFLSRIDVLLDSRLDALAEGDASGDGETARRARELRGRAAVASAKGAFAVWQRVFSSERYRRLEGLGARPQRLLWASTGVKDPSYPPTKYVEPLVGAGTITTMPRETLDAYRAVGEPAPRLAHGLDEADRTLAALGELGIDVDEATAQLEREGVEKFVRPFESLLSVLDRAVERATAS